MKFVEKAIKIIFIILSLLFGGWFILPMFKGVICIGNVFGLLLCGFVFLRFVFSAWFKGLKCKLYKRGITKFFWRLCRVGISLFTIYAITATCAMLYFSTIAPNKNSTVIALGAMVHKNNTPSASLNSRINACYNYLMANKDAVAVLSGGQGENENISEARCMYDYLSDKGIEKERLYIEDKSTNTLSNIKNSYTLIKENNLPKNIAITTDGYHQLRAVIIAKKLGIDGDIGAVNSKTPISVLPTYYVREWFALPVEILK